MPIPLTKVPLFGEAHLGRWIPPEHHTAESIAGIYSEKQVNIHCLRWFVEVPVAPCTTSRGMQGYIPLSKSFQSSPSTSLDTKSVPIWLYEVFEPI